jgi:hypothetical protein
MTELGGDKWRRLLFRDYLRSDPDERSGKPSSSVSLRTSLVRIARPTRPPNRTASTALWSRQALSLRRGIFDFGNASSGLVESSRPHGIDMTRTPFDFETGAIARRLIWAATCAETLQGSNHFMACRNLR